MEESNNPKHIAIILDGNRRYGKKKGNKLLGHQKGAKKVEKLFDWCEELEISEITLYTFSTENFNRPQEEVDYLMNLFRKQFKKLRKDKRFKEKRSRFNFIGRLNLFPYDLQNEMFDIMNETLENPGLIINFAVGYGGRAEIVDAVNKILIKKEKNKINSEITEDILLENLYLHSSPDILIRTGGEKRISNFLLYQTAYTELFFLDKMWPEFTKTDLVKIIKEFKERERRFGK